MKELLQHWEEYKKWLPTSPKGFTQHLLQKKSLFFKKTIITTKAPLTFEGFMEWLKNEKSSN